MLALIIDPLLATVLIFLSVISWRFMPPRPAWLGAVSTAVLFALLTGILIYSLGWPLEPAIDRSSPGMTLWYQLILAGWWLLAARTVLVVARSILLTGRRSREAKLVTDLVSGGVYLAALLHVINTVFSVPIGGLVATSGVIAIVLALALQNTLADVFAGIAVGIEGPVSVGDRVWIEGPIEGEIVEINWRSIRIRTDSNDIAIVPHSVVAKSRIINRDHPTARRGDSIQISCNANVMPDQAIDLLKRAVLLCPMVLKEPAPSIALIRLGARRNDYQIAFSVASSSQLWAARNMLMKEVSRQFHYAGIAPLEPRRTALDGAAEPAARTTPWVSDPYPLDRLLDEISLFHGLSREHRQMLAGKLIRHALEPQDIVFAQGATEASLFIIASGVLEVTRQTPERSYVVGRIGAGDYIGEIGMLTGAPHAATVTALTPCIVYELCKKDVAPILAETPELVAALEASARRGQELIARAVAAGASTEVGPPGQLLARIRSFFNLPH